MDLKRVQNNEKLKKNFMYLMNYKRHQKVNNRLKGQHHLFVIEIRHNDFFFKVSLQFQPIISF